MFFFSDSSVDLPIAVRRILWGKFINAGQTCVAPDYILCSKDIQEQFINEAKAVFKEWYGDDIKRSPDLTRIINAGNFQWVSSKWTALTKINPTIQTQ